MKEVKVISKNKFIDKRKVYDIEVEDAHHYILSNGIVSHNSGGMFAAKKQSGGDGPIYSASVIIFLWKSNLKDSSNKTKTGIIVGSNLFKSRYTKAIDIQFHISFANGMNPYVGLENYISWESCGIEKGNILTQKEYAKLSDKEKKKVYPFMSKEYLELNKENREKIDSNEEEKIKYIIYFSPKKTAQNYIVKHLGDKISTKELFTPRVFTKEVLIELDNNVIKDTFRLPNLIEDTDQLSEILEDIEDSNNE